MKKPYTKPALAKAQKLTVITAAPVSSKGTPGMKKIYTKPTLAKDQKLAAITAIGSKGAS